MFRHKYSFFLRGRYRKYEEVIMPNSDVDKITRDIIDTFTCTAEKIKKTNATPIFSAICPMSVITWNRRCLSPRLANPVIYRRKDQVRCRYGKLVDGVHPNRNLQKEWVDILDKVLDLNRSTPIHLPSHQPTMKPEEEYDSDSSEKRSWLYW